MSGDGRVLYLQLFHDFAYQRESAATDQCQQRRDMLARMVRDIFVCL